MQELETISLDKMRAFLESRSVKPSYQRLKILEYLMRNRNHPSVDTIFQALCGEIPTLSKTTVYNTLSLFAEKAIATSLTIVNNELRYDLLNEPHAHFQCAECKRVFDVPMKENLFFTNFLEDHRVEEIQVTIKGICKNCLKIENTLDKIS
jgi:Fur family peroxide stress response transcriptional regulator